MKWKHDKLNNCHSLGFYLHSYKHIQIPTLTNTCIHQLIYTAEAKNISTESYVGARLNYIEKKTKIFDLNSIYN